MRRHIRTVLSAALVVAMTMNVSMAAMAETGGPGAVEGESRSSVITAGQGQSQVDYNGPGGEAGPQAPGDQPSNQPSYRPVDTSLPAGVIQDSVILDAVYGQNGQIINLNMKLNQVAGAISYGVYVNNGGYLPWQGDGAIAGGTEESTYIEAIQVAITGEAAKLYNVYYRGVSALAGQHGWASNEEMMGTVDRGDHLTSIEVYLVPKENGAPGSYEGRFFTNHSESISIGDTGTTYRSADGSGFTGWVDHDRSRYYFVDGQAVTGWQYIDGLKFYFNERGALIMDVDPIIGPQSSYQLKVNKELNCLTVYAKDGDNGYILPVKSMLTSVGDDTPIGTFRTPEKYRWRFMVNETYTQYATRITAGFLFHSITYETTKEDTLITPGYNMLGVTRSLGCVRLNCWNAKWVYDNCKLGTEVVIYNDGTTPGPFFKPYQVWIPADQKYDPTDPKFAGL